MEFLRSEAACPLEYRLMYRVGYRLGKKTLLRKDRNGLALHVRDPCRDA